MLFFNVVIVALLIYIFEVYISKKSINSTFCNLVIYQLLRKFLIYNISKISIYCTRNSKIYCYIFFELKKTTIFFSYKLIRFFSSFLFIIFLYYQRENNRLQIYCKIVFY